jgi:ABC-type Fe3+ transport system substrate-binding protein
MLALGCGAAPARSPAGPGAAGAPAAPATADDYRAAVIEGARAEGAVNATITSTWTPDGLRELEDAVERQFGVRVKIDYTPVGSYPQRVASLLDELGANVTPSFDLYQTSDASSLTLLQQEALETVSWGALLPDGTPPTVVQLDGALLVFSTGHIGLMFDPTVYAEAEVPRSIHDLANVKFRGKLMLHNYSQSYLAYTYKLGRESTLAALRGAVRNGAASDIYANGFTRYAAKEYPLVTTSSSYYLRAVGTNLPASFVPLDFSFETEHHLSVAKRAAHPNAAKLLAAVLAGPEGQRIAAKRIENANRHYPDTAESQLEAQAHAAGLTTFRWTESPEAMRLLLSPEGVEVQREINTILQGG